MFRLLKDEMLDLVVVEKGYKAARFAYVIADGGACCCVILACCCGGGRKPR